MRAPGRSCRDRCDRRSRRSSIPRIELCEKSGLIARAVTHASSVRGRLPQQGIAAGSMIALLTEQHIEGYTRHIVGHGFHPGILFLVENLAVAAALLTS